ncbi:hypothetical protein MRB53_041305 [Persea americana]|nr:hypothetical protein MRB53_041305 [Persea americana]
MSGSSREGCAATRKSVVIRKVVGQKEMRLRSGGEGGKLISAGSERSASQTPAEAERDSGVRYSGVRASAAGGDPGFIVWGQCVQHMGVDRVNALESWATRAGSIQRPHEKAFEATHTPPTTTNAATPAAWRFQASTPCTPLTSCNRRSDGEAPTYPADLLLPSAATISLPVGIRVLHFRVSTHFDPLHIPKEIQDAAISRGLFAAGKEVVPHACIAVHALEGI